MPTKTGKLTKRERQAQMRAQALQALGKLGAGVERVLTHAIDSGALPRAGTTVLGAIALYPQSFEVRASEMFEFRNHFEKRENPFWNPDCTKHCYEGGHSADWIVQCLKDCARTPRYTDVLTGVDQHWRFTVAVQANLHTLIPAFGLPDVKVEYPIFGGGTTTKGFNLRDAFSFEMIREAWGFQATDDPNAETGKNAAFEQAKDSIRKDLLAMGIAGGLAGPEAMKAVTTMFDSLMRGIGEVVPG